MNLNQKDHFWGTQHDKKPWEARPTPKNALNLVEIHFSPDFGHAKDLLGWDALCCPRLRPAGPVKGHAFTKFRAADLVIIFCTLRFAPWQSHAFVADLAGFLLFLHFHKVAEFAQLR